MYFFSYNCRLFENVITNIKTGQANVLLHLDIATPHDRVASVQI